MGGNVIQSPDTFRAERLPPGQRRTAKWPVRHIGNVPPFDPATWDLSIFPVPLVERVMRFTWPEFLALPRVKDFRGLNPKSFDGRGNYAMGLKEHIVFPEIAYDDVDQVWGMDVIVCTTADNDDEARALLRGFNFPFRT